MSGEKVRVVCDLAKARELVRDGLHIDGGHHKQWYLEQIGLALGIEIDKERELGIIGDEEGIAP